MVRFRTACRHGSRRSRLRRFLRRPTVASTRTCEYYWGPDRSGTEQGAGGVEGLLAVSSADESSYPDKGVCEAVARFAVQRALEKFDEWDAADAGQVGAGEL